MNRFHVIVLLISAGFSAVGFSQTYTTHFEGAENPLSEDGRWANHGLDWTQIRKKDGVAFGTQAGTNTGIYKFDDSYAQLSGFPPDQEAWGQAHISKLNAPCIQELEILLRWTSSAHRTTGYECFARCVNDGSSYVQVVRWDGPLGKFTYLADHRGTNYGLKDGDILKASIIGNVITVFVNGVEKARVTDSTFASGDPGIGEFLACEGARGVGSNPDFGFSSFTARAMGGTNANAGSGPRPVLEAEQTDRHGGMIARWNSLLDLRGDDGLRFVIGFEHWCLYDPSVSNWFDFDNFGLATLNDNAYDGTEARRAPGRDARGCPIGGEESDYGDLLGPVREYLRGVDARLAGR